MRTIALLQRYRAQAQSLQRLQALQNQAVRRDLSASGRPSRNSITAFPRQ